MPSISQNSTLRSSGRRHMKCRTFWQTFLICSQLRLCFSLLLAFLATDTNVNPSSSSTNSTANSAVLTNIALPSHVFSMFENLMLDFCPSVVGADLRAKHL